MVFFLQNYLSLSISRNLQSVYLSNFTGHQEIITKHLLVKFDSFSLCRFRDIEKCDFLKTTIGYLGMNRGSIIITRIKLDPRGLARPKKFASHFLQLDVKIVDFNLCFVDLERLMFDYLL